MSRIRKRYLIPIIIAIIMVGVLAWVRYYVFDAVAVNLNERMQSLRFSGFNVRYDSLRVDWRGNVIEIDNVIIERNAYDTTCIYPEFISVGKIRAEGLGLAQLIFRNVLSLKALHLDGTRMVLRQNSLLKLDSTAQRRNEFTLKVDELYMLSADITYTDSAHCNTIAGVKTNLSLLGLNLDFHIDKPLAYDAESITLDSVEVHIPAEYYTFRVLQAVWNTRKSAFRADSIRITPDLGKIQFGRTHGYEVDRFECLIPSLAASGIAVAATDSLQVQVGLAEIQFQLKVFRDKRLPFLRKEKPLPLDALRKLPFLLGIDSLKILNSFVQYDEFAEGTSEPGGIYFDGLNASLKNISNSAAQGNMLLVCQARLFGNGDVSLYGTFPFEKDRRASVQGSIRDFSLPRLNAILTPSTQLEVESGEMEELLFNFTFTDTRSDGEIELKYRNLKLITFKDQAKTGGAEPEIDNFKTFMMNAFVFRKNMTEDTPEEKRKGAISFTRDNSKSIFNFWSKSLISGIKAAYNLEKTVQNKPMNMKKKNNRDIKKEERALRREARNQRRAERKRERG